MITLIAAALAAAAQPAPAAPAQPHAGHPPMAGMAKDKDCCCKDMAKGDAKMGDHAEHGESHDGDHAAHSASR